MERPAKLRLIRILAIAAIYYFSARLGLLMAIGNTNASPVWPPSGFAFAAIILLGYKKWPGILLGAFAANVTVFSSHQAADLPTILGMSAFISVGNTLEALAGHYLLNLFKARQILTRTRDFTFFFIAALLMCMVSSTVGTTTLYFGHIINVQSWRNVLFTWWMGDVSGIIVLTPVLLSCWHTFRKGIDTRILPRFIIIFPLVLFAYEAIFNEWITIVHVNAAMYLVLVVFAWCVYSIEQWQSSIIVLLIASLSIWNTIHGSGPFVLNSENDSLLSLQVFLCVSAITMMFLSTTLNERKRSEAKLQFANLRLARAKQQLEETMKVKENFLANMSHEIRTPMNAIVGFTELLGETKLDKEQLQYVGSVKRSGENLLVIINDILDFSKLRSGKVVFEQTSLRLSTIVNSVHGLVQSKASQKNISLLIQIDKDVPDELLGDPTRLSQILINLIDNAIKFTHQGGVSLHVRLKQELTRTVTLTFEVRDTGIGIAEQKLDRIFDGFTQAETETTRKYGGTGLGLAIVKELVELQRGAIDVRSRVGEGSVFTFTLSFVKDTRMDEAAEAAQQYGSIAHLRGKRILLVEDNEQNQILIHKILDDFKCDVKIVDNGMDAVFIAMNNDFDLILMDIQLPGIDGIEVTKMIRKKNENIRANVPILAVTAHAFSGQEDRCLRSGMNAYLSKPFSKRALGDKMIEALFTSQRPKRKRI